MKGVVNLTRWILSICLFLASILHINLLSFIYVLCFLSLPWSLISSPFFRLRFFFILSLITLILSSSFLLINISLQLFALTNKGNERFHQQCSLHVRILSYIGWTFWMHTTNKILFVLISINHGMIICVSLGVLLTHKRKKIVRSSSSSRGNLNISDHFQSIPLRIRPLFIYFRSIFLLLLIYTCGCLIPSILSSFYFLISLGLAFWWALGKHFGRNYLYLIRLLQIYSFIHFIFIYLSHYSFIEDYFLHQNLYFRQIFALISLYKNACLQQQTFFQIDWIRILHPLIILILYWITIYEYHLTKKYQTKFQHLFSDNNSSIQETFHLHSITDLFWFQPSNSLINNKFELNRFYKTNSLLVAFLSFILTKAYMLSIISMLLWSITYHSYLTFPYLILACLIWLLPKSKYWCHLISPIFCLYAYILLIMNYLNLLNFIQNDFSKRINEYEENQQLKIGIYIKCLMKFLFTIFLLLSFRQRRQEIKQKHSNISSLNFYEHIELMPPIRPKQSTSSSDSSSISRFHRLYIYLKFQWKLIHYEIYYIFYTRYAHICLYNIFFNWSRLLIITLIFILSYDSRSYPIAYRIVYMGFFLHYHLCYSINNSLWKIYLFPFYLTLIIYSMILLFLIYIYQFQELKFFQTRFCFGLFSCRLLFSSLGIRYVEKHILGRELFIPTVFIITIVMHINFFHRTKKNFIEIHSSKVFFEDSNIRILNWIQSIEKSYEKIRKFLWNLVELFVYKILLFIICFVFTQQSNISPMNCLVMIVFVCSLFFPILQNLTLAIYALISSMYILILMIIRLEIFIHLGDVKNLCQINHPILSKRLIAPLEWFGLWTINTSNMTVGELIIPYLSIVLSIAILQFVRRQKSSSLIELFYSIKTSLLTKSTDQLKDFYNYFIYRFGLELSLFSSLCLIIFRMDAIAFIHALIILNFLLLPRSYVRRFWKIYRIFASISAIWLYLNALGFPSVLCLKHILDQHRIFFQLKGYLYLSDYFEYRPLSSHLFFDFALLIILFIQEMNFTFEQMNHNTNEELISSSYHPNLLDDFITNSSLSWINRFKSFFYSYSYWFLIAYLYIILIYHQSIFYLLILLACFFLLWHGQSFLQRTYQQQKSFWHLLILSFFSLFLSYLILQPLSCIFIQDLSISYRSLLKQVFNIPCSIKFFQRNCSNQTYPSNSTQDSFFCQKESNYLFLDVFGFLFILLFIRLLNSSSFLYVRLELQVQNELSQIGASLLSQLNWLKLVEYRQRTANELESIKKRVTQIRQRRNMQKREADIPEPIYHYPAILSGDYYMFDYPLDAPNDSNVFLSSESDRSISLLDIFDWKTYEEEEEEEKYLNEWNNSHWNEEMPSKIDLSSLFTFLQLKENSEKIRQTLDTMNSRLIIYLGQHVRTLLIISQVISDAKLYLKYPSESAQLITTVVPENINEYITKTCEQTGSNRPKTITATTLPIEENSPINEEKIVQSSNHLHSKLWTWFRSNIKTKEHSIHSSYSNEYQTPSERSIKKEKLPEKLEKHLEKLKQSRLHIGPGTILLTFIISKFDYLTYSTIILNFLASGGALIWLPLLISIYFWAILTFPYPSRRFWYVITLSSMFILLIQYNLTFISSLSANQYIRHSLIGHLNLFANVLLLGILSFHRIILHQLGLWDDFHPPTEDSLIYQATFIPSNIKVFRNEIIREIYSILKKDIENDQKVQTKNFNALDDENEVKTQRTIPIPTILSEEAIDQMKSETVTSENRMKNYFHEKISHWIDHFKHLFYTIKKFYSFAIACPIVPKVDYYSSIFLCDFLVIFFIIAGHQRFSHSDSVQDNIIYRYLQGSSSLDITPILMLLTHFLLIIVDRIIYLKKNVHAKFLFLCFQFLVLHIWLVIIYPIWFQREISTNWAAISIYILKSFYFMLSALQIRNGYPTRILGNFLTRRYSVLRLLSYKLYCTIPFLYEMRVLMDWMFIPTSLSLTYYFMMEEIARNAWIQKCWRMTDARAPTKRAQNRGRCERYCVGGWILFAIIFVIWFPLIFFSASTSLADPIPIDRCEIKLRLSTYKELYQLVTANVREPTSHEFHTQIRPFILNSTFASGPREFTAADVACIHALGHVGAQWTISPSALNQLKNELKHFLEHIESSNPQIYFDYSIIRKGQTNEQDVLPSGYIITLSGTHNVSLSKTNAEILLKMISSENQTKETITIEQILPKFIHLLPDMIDITSPTYLQDIQLTLRREKQLLWWDTSELANSHWKNKCSFKSESLNLITISERAGAQSKSFNFISKLLIGSSAKLTLIGVYAGLVYVLWLTCFRQTLFSDIQLIMYHEWPFADRVEKLCEEVYLVRELGELQLEEELFARLIFLHRSPETLIRLTRPKNLKKTSEEHLHEN